jgi:hypothetical protein
METEMYRIAEESSGTADIGFSVQHVHDRVLLPEGGLKSFMLISTNDVPGHP